MIILHCNFFVYFVVFFVSGRHCDIHQMIGNYMWDEMSKAEFLIGTNPDSKMPLWWNGSEPLWVTLQKLGKKVFMYFWPGEHFLWSIIVCMNEWAFTNWICKFSGLSIETISALLFVLLMKNFNLQNDLYSS